ncbi:hypothetical protein [Glycomyces niveus]|uniref:Uncharacterized protein n=1 Tax=Glycomyces niveus TaxID=2820287 RepID=A0ABS3U5Z8_9ACTN|nr:hypothetical protein [Glycomyces sp. NEAU-S30]MBO3734183.1 hypothetical protein [Glycomyces sp. NEAU-S30]
MDLFSRTMLACSAEAGLTSTALARHVPLLRRNIGSADQVSLLSRCVGSDGLGSGDHVLMLTGERMVVTRQSRLLGRVRLCLDAPVAAIENLRWSADPAGPGVELNFTVLEGPGATEPHRWHFWLPATHAKRVWRIDALLARAFRRPKADARPAADRLGSASAFGDLDLVEDAASLDRNEDTVALMRTEITVSLKRMSLVRTALADVLPVGAGHPTSPFPAPDPRLTTSAAVPAQRRQPSPRSFLPPVVTDDERPALPVRAVADDAAINAPRPRAPRPTGFQPSDLETTMALNPC